MNQIFVISNFNALFELIESTIEYGTSNHIIYNVDDSTSRISVPIKNKAASIVRDLMMLDENGMNRKRNFAANLHAILRVMSVPSQNTPHLHDDAVDPIYKLRWYYLAENAVVADQTLQSHIETLIHMFVDVDVMASFTPTIFKDGEDAIAESPASRGIFYISGVGKFKHQRYRYLRPMYKRQSDATAEEKMGVHKIPKSAMRTPNGKLMNSKTKQAALLYAWIYALRYSGDFQHILNMYNLSVFKAVDVNSGLRSLPKSIILPSPMSSMLHRSLGIVQQEFETPTNYSGVMGPLIISKLAAMSREEFVDYVINAVRGEANRNFCFNFRPRDFDKLKLSYIGGEGPSILQENIPCLYKGRFNTAPVIHRNVSSPIPWVIPVEFLRRRANIEDILTPAYDVENGDTITRLFLDLVSTEKFARLSHEVDFYMASYEVYNNIRVDIENIRVVNYFGENLTLQIISLPVEKVPHAVKLVVEYRKEKSNRWVVSVNEWQ